jgi:uncharacterized protein (DUF934 family)
MAIFRDDCFLPDDWRNLAQTEEFSPKGKVILTVPQWQAVRADLPGDISLGLLIEPERDLQTVALDLSRFALIAVAFPKFTDGRGYSHARHLRGTYGFAGELRATGEILFDQLQFLTRCGFDSFDISDAVTIQLLEAGRRPCLGIFYQPALGLEMPERTRTWARRAAS